jgi:HK97 gp10 family phage protein
MADSFMELKGFKELADAMREMPERVAQNALRSAVAAGATVIREEARKLAPVDTGEMRRDILVKRERGNRSNPMVATYSVFVRSGKKSRLAGKKRDVQRDSFYWRFVEFGTAKMAAQPFMRPAFEARKEAAVEAIRAKLDDRIQKTATELAKK